MKNIDPPSPIDPFFGRPPMGWTLPPGVIGFFLALGYSIMVPLWGWADLGMPLESFRTHHHGQPLIVIQNQPRLTATHALEVERQRQGRMKSYRQKRQQENALQTLDPNDYMMLMVEE